MPIENDTDIEVSAPATKVAGVDAATLASELADSKARQAGLNKAVDKIKSQLTEKESQLLRLSEAHETEAAELRRTHAEATVAANLLRSELAAAVEARTTAERTLTSFQQREATRAQVAASHPGLLPVLDDLKGRPDFADDAAYASYLDRMQSTLFKSSPAYATGSVPPVTRPAATPSNPNGVERSVADITADLWNPVFEARETRVALELELEAAMKRQRRN